MGLVLAFIGGTIFLGARTVPKFIDLIGRMNSYDVLILALLGVAFGMAFIAFELGISVAAGAFFAGVLVAESKMHSVSVVLATPLRDMFAALFFISIGALMDISLIPTFIVPALVLVEYPMQENSLLSGVQRRAQGFDKLTSARAGFGLSSSGGELALVTAQGGAATGGDKCLFTSDDWCNDNHYYIHVSLCNQIWIQVCRAMEGYQEMRIRLHFCHRYCRKIMICIILLDAKITKQLSKVYLSIRG